MTIWKEKELTLKDLKKVKSLKFCKTDASWINCCHKGIPAIRTEKAYIIGRWDLPAVNLLLRNEKSTLFIHEVPEHIYFLIVPLILLLNVQGLDNFQKANTVL